MQLAFVNNSSTNGNGQIDVIMPTDVANRSLGRIKALFHETDMY